MTAPDSRDSVIEDLRALLALAERATPDWTADRFGVLRAGPRRKYPNGEAQSQIASFVHDGTGPDPDTQRIIDRDTALAAVNFIRAHGSEVLQALARGPQQAGGEDVVRLVIYRLHRVVEGGPLAYDAIAIGEAAEQLAALQAEVARLRESLNERQQALEAVTLIGANAEAALREAGRDAEDAKRWRSFRQTRSIRAEGLTPEHWDAREDAHIAAAEADAYDAAINGGQDDA